MNILVVQNSPLNPPGILADCILAREANLTIIMPTEEDKLPDKDNQLFLSDEGFDGLIVMGGAMNAEEDDKYPHLLQIVNLIQQFYAKGKAIMGVCLGAQLLARAFGKRVYRNHIPEIGFTPVFPLEVASADYLLQISPAKIYLMQWHFDSFELPETATLLMSNDICRNQAFRIGDNVYGFQFHLEVTREIVQNWVSYNHKVIEEQYPELLANFAQQMDEYIDKANQFGRHIGDGWLDLVKAKFRSTSNIF
ncbi:MAG: type 1 glutamine amidotransferase [Nostocaceae cyanobacterium]|nr:type 1 glutamine amidotransferase [Nostocaceae cyanobacterium]